MPPLRGEDEGEGDSRHEAGTLSAVLQLVQEGDRDRPGDVIRRVSTDYDRIRQDSTGFYKFRQLTTKFDKHGNNWKPEPERRS